MKIIKFHENAELPKRAHIDDAGADCKAVSVTYFDNLGNIINSREGASKVSYSIGIGVEIPAGFMLVIAPKSSVHKRYLTLANSIGIIDKGYQGELIVNFYINENSIPYEVGDAVCQIILIPISTPDFEWGEFSEKTDRGEGGFGSTGNVFEGNYKIRFDLPYNKHVFSNESYKTVKHAEDVLINIMQFKKENELVFTDGETKAHIVKIK